MIETFKTKDGKYIIYQDGRAEVVDKAELQKELEFNQAQLASLPERPADKDLLAWAKENYTQVKGIEASRTIITSTIEKLQTQLAELK